LGEPAGQPFAKFCPRGFRVAFVEAAPGRQQRTRAVGFYCTAFQSKINGLARAVEERSIFVEAFDQAIVAAGLELAAPAGEAEVEQAETVAVARGDRAGVAQPCVVVFAREEPDPVHVAPR